MTSSNTTTFATSDISIVAALEMQGHLPIKRFVVDGRQVIFEFADSPELQRVLTAYADGSLFGSIRQHSEAVREIAATLRPTRKNATRVA
jgi:hypothetical protein